ncbi:MAG: efflux RND transporter periplasmic adaptor subunit [Bacteroidota bacterium]
MMMNSRLQLTYPKWGFLLPGPVWPLCLLLILGVACQGSEPATDQEISRQELEADLNWVDTLHLRPGVFSQQWISNGRLVAHQQADLSFRIAENIRRVPVRNGQRVRKGQLLGELEPSELKGAHDLAQLAVEKARIRWQDELLNLGYETADSAMIPPETWRSSRLRSGLADAEAQLKASVQKLGQTYLYAPFSGVVADLEAQAFQASENFSPYCRLMDDRRFNVSFPVLESEWTYLEIGQPVEVMPYGRKEGRFSGKVTEINPLVNDQGMIQVKASIPNPGAKLISGMHVKVVLGKKWPDQLIIPKSALVLRQGRHVVFTWQNDTALWKYVDVGMENTTSYTVVEGLAAEEIVITSGNLNLSHKAPIRIQPQQ